jgi:hypothetical protein
MDIVGPNSGVSNGVTYVTGRVGQAFRFDTNGIVTAPTTGMPIGSNERSLELWVRIDQVSSHQPFFAGYGSFGSAAATFHVGALANGGLSYFSQWGQALFGVNLPTGTWTHVVATKRGATTYLYLNGSVSAAGVITINTPAATSFHIGRIGGSWGSTERLNGAVDEVTVYDRALTDTEIAELANAPLGKCR